MVNAQRVFLKENSHFLQDRPHGPVFLFENPPMMHFQIRNRWYKKISPGPGRDTWWGHLVGTPGRDTYDQHESLRLRRAVLQFTLPTSREHITLTHSHSRTYTPKDIIRTQKINILGKTFKTVYKLSIRLSIRKSKKFHFRCNIVIQIVYRM